MAFSKRIVQYRWVVAAAAAACIVLALGSWTILSKVEAIAREDTRNALKTVVGVTHEAVKSWVKEQQSDAEIWANSVEVGKFVADLLKVRPARQTLSDTPAQLALRLWLQPVLRSKGYLGYFIVGPDKINLASSRDSNLGVTNLLTGQHDFMNKVWSGQAAMSLPLPSDVPLPDKQGNLVAQTATMFVGAPVYDADEEVIAILMFRIDPKEDFSRVLRQGRIGESGETYAFDKYGRMISESRFRDQLKRIGVVDPDLPPNLDVVLRDPGVDLVAGGKPSVPRLGQPLTVMARDAVSANSSDNVVGYRDYRGVSVVGAWIWDGRLKLGLTTEIDTAEAYQTLSVYKAIITVGTLLIAVLVAVLATLFVLNRERKLAQLEVALQRDKLTDLNKQKDKFFSIIAHDLLGPFTVLLNYSAILKRKAESMDREKIADISDSLNASSEQVLTLLEDLLDWSLAQTNQIEFVPAPHNIHELAQEALLALDPVARQKGIELNNQSGSDIVMVDSQMTKTIIRNLVNNAIKFTPEHGRIKLSAKPNGDDLEVMVADTGVGIPQDQLEILFDIDEKTSTIGTGGETGTGLGLKLCKELVERQGGEITVESVLGEGTKFSFTLPLHQDAA